MDIPWDTVRSALQAKVVDGDCPACQVKAGWDGGEALFRVPLSAERAQNGQPRNEAAKPGLAVVSISCANCGFVRLFELTALLADRH